jgi:hypothetical protein
MTHSLAARRALGSAAHARHDLHRDARTFTWLDDARRDMAHGPSARCEGRPAFTAIAVITLALGIGANTDHLQRHQRGAAAAALPYRNAERLVQVFTPPPNIPGAHRSRGATVISTGAFRRFARQHAHPGVRRWIYMTSATLTGRGDAVTAFPVCRLTASLFPLHGVPPVVWAARYERHAKSRQSGDDVVVSVISRRTLWPTRTSTAIQR